jgi:putative MATE family efflux protein
MASASVSTAGSIDTTRAERGEIRELIQLAAPLALAFGGNQLLSVVDTAMVGRLGATELAGVALGSGLFFAVSVLGMGAVLGMDPLVSQAVGAGEGARARAVVRAALRLATVLGLGLSVVAGAAPLLLGAAGVDAGTRHEALMLVLGRIPGMVPVLWVLAIRSYLQAAGVTRPILLSVVAANLVNVVANGLLIFGDAALLRVGLPAVGLPALGVLGAGLGSSLATVAQLGVCWWALGKATIAGAGETAVGARDVLRIGWPISLTLLAEVGAFAGAGVLAGNIGATAAAGHQVAITIASMTFCVSMGIASATTVRVGRAIGRGDAEGARRVRGDRHLPRLHDRLRGRARRLRRTHLAHPVRPARGARRGDPARADRGVLPALRWPAGHRRRCAPRHRRHALHPVGERVRPLRGGPAPRGRPRVRPRDGGARPVVGPQRRPDRGRGPAPRPLPPPLEGAAGAGGLKSVTTTWSRPAMRGAPARTSRRHARRAAPALVKSRRPGARHQAQPRPPHGAQQHQARRMGRSSVRRAAWGAAASGAPHGAQQHQAQHEGRSGS